MLLRKVTSLLYASLMVCSSMTCSIPNAKTIEFKISQANTNDKIKIKDIKDLENEVEQIKINRENNERKAREEQEQLKQEELKKSRREFILTFYTSLDFENGYGAITCTGQRLNDGIVANNVLDLGTKIQLDGYGEVVVADRGGNSFNTDDRLDVFVPKEDGESNYSYEKRVNNMGKVKVTGHILK